MNTSYKYQPETIELSAKLYKLGPKTVASFEQQTGIVNHEPLIVILDSCLRYAKAHQIRYGEPLAEDYVLGPAFEQTLEGIRSLLNGLGALSNEKESNTDSKDNGVCSDLVQECLKVGGFPEL
jgi:hypothetical protein